MSSTRPHASERLGERDIAALAKCVRKNHNLCALLLRLLDREEWRDDTSSTSSQLANRALAAAQKAGLAAWPDAMVGGGLHHWPGLTPTGREVAEHCRPPKWTAAIRNAYSTMDERAQYVAIDQPDGTTGFSTRSDGGDGGEGQRHAFDRAQRIVDLLNADDLARAKVYGAKP